VINNFFINLNEEKKKMKSPRNSGKTWTERAEQVVVECYPTMSSTKVGKRLGRSASAVRNKACALGVEKK
jgi:hypothetical protein